MALRPRGRRRRVFLFCKEILTPTVLGQLLGALTPAYQRLLAPKPPTDCLFHGATGGAPHSGGAEDAGEHGPHGRTHVGSGGLKVLVYLRRGEVVHVSGFDPVAYAAESALNISQGPRGCAREGRGRPARNG